MRDKILSQTEITPSGCVLWTGYKSAAGYGQIGFAGRKHYGHRLLYEMFKGPIPEGLELDHLCRRRACVSPAHLEAVTHAENVRRGDAAMRQLRKTHCPQGHPYTGENLYTPPSGGRECRACAQGSRRRYEERKRVALR